MISIYSRSPDPATVDHDVLAHFFSSEQGNNDTTFYHRKGSGPSRGFLRILFPKFLLKLKEHKGHQRYRLKPDLLASFMFFVFVAVGVAWTIDPSAADGSPSWLPLVFAGWYVLRAVYEIVKTKAALDLATSGVSLPESDVVARVTALLEAEQAESDDV